MHPYRMDPCPQGTHSRGVSIFMGVPVHKAPLQGGSMDPWEYGDGTGARPSLMGLHGGGGQSRQNVFEIRKPNDSELKLDPDIYVGTCIFNTKQCIPTMCVGYKIWQGGCHICIHCHIPYPLCRILYPLVIYELCTNTSIL